MKSYYSLIKRVLKEYATKDPNGFRLNGEPVENIAREINSKIIDKQMENIDKSVHDEYLEGIMKRVP